MTINETEALALLTKVANYATRPVIKDSCGQPLVTLRQALIEEVRDFLATQGA